MISDGGGKVAEEEIGKLKVGSRAAPKHVLQERNARNEKERDGDIKVVVDERSLGLWGKVTHIP